MREVKEVIYEKEDYDKLKEMSVDEVIRTLDHIDDGWIGSSSYYGQENYEGDESDYDRYRLHQALRKAINILEEIKKERD